VNIEQAEVRLGHAMVPVRLEFGVAGVLQLLEDRRVHRRAGLDELKVCSDQTPTSWPGLIRHLDRIESAR
jgi:hypothetical protein